MAVSGFALGSLAPIDGLKAQPAAAGSTWDIKTAPPAMPGATEITITADSATSPMPAWGILCSGQYHRIALDADEDAVITFGGSDPLQFPVWVVGGNNVRLVGFDMELVTQPGCDIGDLPNSGSTATNIHPRIPSAMAVRLENYGTSYVEGANIDLTGHEADCFVVRNPADLTNAAARNQRHVVLQNTSCTGVEGLGQSDIGDGVHGDLLQNQGNDVISSLTIENVSMRSSMEGLVLHEWDGYAGARDLTIRRFDYAADERYDNDDAYEQWGVAFAAWADDWTLEQIHIEDPRDNDYGFVNDQRWGGFSHGVVQQHPAISRSLPAGGTFAPAASIGANYVSPHDGTAPATPGQSTTGEIRTDQIIRLYQAAFGRIPDAHGQSYWQAQSDSGMSLQEMGAHFQHSAEWDSRFGKNPTADVLVDRLYQNVLGRPADAGGRSHWIGQLNSGAVTPVRLLLIFSESPENVERTGTVSPA